MTTVPPQRDRSRAVIQVVSRSDLSRTIMAASLAPADLGDDGTMIGGGPRSGREPVTTTWPRARTWSVGRHGGHGRKDGQLLCQRAIMSRPVSARKALDAAAQFVVKIADDDGIIGRR